MNTRNNSILIGLFLLVFGLCQQALAAEESGETTAPTMVSARTHKVVGITLLAASLPIRIAGMMTIWMAAIGDCIDCDQGIDPLYYVGGGTMAIGQAAASIGWGHAVQGSHVARSHSQGGHGECHKTGTGAIISGVSLLGAGLAGFGVSYAIKERDSIDAAIAPILASTATFSVGSNVLGVGLVRRKYHRVPDNRTVTLYPQVNFLAGRIGLLAQIRL